MDTDTNHRIGAEHRRVPGFVAMNTAPELVWSVQRFAPDPDTIYSIDTVAHLAGASRHDVVAYCKHGLVSPLVDPEYGGWYFDDDGLKALQRIGYLHDQCGVNFTGIKIILELMQEVERLRGKS